MGRRFAPYVQKKLAEQVKRLKWLKKNRVQRFRSAVFSLPEFANRPMLSVVAYARTSEELTQFEAIRTSITIDSVEFFVLTAKGLSSESNSAIMHTLVPDDENECMALNSLAVKSTGKIVTIFTSIASFQRADLSAMIHSISTHEDHLLVVSIEEEGSTIALARDMYLLARGLDELFLEAEIAIQDLALRSALLGSRIDRSFSPNELAMLNIEKGELFVNEGAENFRKLYFEVH